ncbi:MAG: nitrile hydratase accessory protein [Nitrospinota bacterium]
MPEPADLSALPSIPRPVFREPREAQVFSVTLLLHGRGCFTWKEWTERLGAEIQAAQARGDADLGDTYYLHWLAALEGILCGKRVVTDEVLRQRKAEWSAAARATPHGQPIVLRRGGRGTP